MMSRLARRRLLLPSMLAVAGLSATPASAAVPGQVTHQGRLYDANKQPISGTIELTFAVYDGAMGGAPIWSEMQQATCDQGYFSVQAGSVVPFGASVFDGLHHALHHRFPRVPYYHESAADAALRARGAELETTETFADFVRFLYGKHRPLGAAIQRDGRVEALRAEEDMATMADPL